jgi:DNA (cytosine-5)-methyltransferase 1
MGLIPAGLQKTKEKPGKMFTRINKNGQFSTITTSMSPQDSYCGDVLHWKRPTTISVMEARRAQGFPDNEVLIGTIDEQFRIVGNAVDRYVALAIGLSVRRALDANSKRGIIIPPARRALKTSAILQTEDDGIIFESEDSGDDDNEEEPIKTQRRSITGRLPRVVIEDEEDEMLIEDAEEDLEDELGRNVRRTSQMCKPQRAVPQDEEEGVFLLEQESDSNLPLSVPSKTTFLSAVHHRLSRRSAIIMEQSETDSNASTDILLRSVTVSSSKIVDDSETSLSSELDPLAIRGKRSLEQPSEGPHPQQKKTRHSGLQVEFAPRRWDRAVEKEVRRSDLG